MVCRNCHATIADKAIVCYRCGTPTAEPVVTSSPARRTGSAGSGGTVWALVLAVAAAFLWWQLPGPVTAPARLAAALVAVVAILIALLRRRRAAPRR